ncbi:response regulator transcription factor [Microbacterium resistens]|uniref:response regulator transcription factor n=1 Tax=Microbacterium resistens TaxID=156977 RepID=UPI00366CC562
MEARPRVVLVEDDADVRHAVGGYLHAQGYAVTLCATGDAGRRALREVEADVVVLDRMLPDVSGDELCAELRAGSRAPVLMLTALGDVEDRIEGLELGADDYLAKPFSLRELALRVAALIRRRVEAADAAVVLRDGDFVLDLARRTAAVRGRDIPLAAREFDLLRYLLAHPGRTIGREELLREAWGWDAGDSSTVTVHVRRLREKIEEDPRDPCHLVTEWGTGYRFVPDGGRVRP